MQAKDSKAEEECFQLFKGAADAGHVFAAYNLGKILCLSRLFFFNSEDADSDTTNERSRNEEGRSCGAFEFPQSGAKRRGGSSSEPWHDIRSLGVYAPCRVRHTITLGAMLVAGQGGPANANEAVSWLRQAAEKGDLDAMFNLGAFLIFSRPSLDISH